MGKSVFDQLPKRKDGTKITPWDDDWTNDLSRGIYEPRWSSVPEPVERVWNFKDAEVTCEMVDPGLMMMFVKGAYKEHFGKLYAKFYRLYVDRSFNGG